MIVSQLETAMFKFFLMSSVFLVPIFNVWFLYIMIIPKKWKTTCYDLFFRNHIIITSSVFAHHFSKINVTRVWNSVCAALKIKYFFNHNHNIFIFENENFQFKHKILLLHWYHEKYYKIKLWKYKVELWLIFQA